MCTRTVVHVHAHVHVHVHVRILQCHHNGTVRVNKSKVCCHNSPFQKRWQQTHPIMPK